MKMRNRILLLAAIAAIAMCGAGCSPTIASWADRGQLGCDNEAANADAWRDLVDGYIDAQQKANVAAVFADIRAVSAGQVIGLDGEPVAIDDAWLNESHAALNATLDGLAKRRQAVDEMHARHLANIEATRESLAQISRLNSAWASLNNSGLDAQVARLIEELRRQRTAK